MQSFQVIDLTIPPELAGQRLDSALARLMPEHSRTRIKGWIEGRWRSKLDRVACKPRDIVEAGSRVRVQMTLGEAAQPEVQPEADCTTAGPRRCGTRLGDRQTRWIGGASGGPGIRGIPCKMPCWGLDPTLAALAARRGLIHRLDKGYQRPVGGGPPRRRRKPSLSRQLEARNHGARICCRMRGRHDRRRRKPSTSPSGVIAATGCGWPFAYPAGRPSRTIACWSASALTPT